MELLYFILLVLLIASVLHENFSKDVLHTANKGEQTVPRHLQEPNGYVLNMPPGFPCGQPIPGNESPCQPFSKLQYPKCQSFPGKPRRVEVHKMYNQTNPKLTVEWDAPSIGLNDLWGFQVSIIDLTFSHPSYQCKQINVKAKRFYFQFSTGLNYGGNYQITVQSMPPDGNRSTVIHDISIPDKCNIPAFRLTLMQFCCQFSVVSYQVNKSIIHDTPSIAINITWTLKCNGIEQFNLKWNTTDDAKCSGIANTTDNNYTIILPKTCTEEQHNYTAQLYGITQDAKTETYKFWFTVPSKSSPATSIAPTSRAPTSSDIKIIAAAVSIGIVIGILLVVLLFVFFRQRAASIIRLVDYNLPIPEPEEEQILPDPIKVLILYTGCCMPCKKVIYSLWDVLNCTNLFDVRLDMLSEPKLNENPLRWYELQVKEAARIIIVTSRLMMTADLNPITDTSDYVSIVHQLNLLRGELSNTTDMSKFVPVYMSYNGRKNDVPRFLSMCRTYKLAPELDKIMMHLLGMSSVRKHSKRPIVEVGSDSHPFNEKRAALEKAITDAEHFHNHIHSQCPNTQSNLIV